jgi:hypothetical protein
MLMRAGVAGAGSGDNERVERLEDASEGVLGYEETRVTVAVSALVWRVCVNVLEPSVEDREEIGWGMHW